VMNITDVGHLTEDDLAADTGEDKMELAAKREKKTPEQIANFYTQAFFKDRERLNLLQPHLIPKATEHIKEMIALIKILEKKGFAYWAGEKYFVYDISKFKDYGKLSAKKLKELKVGARLEPIKEKRHPFDFALWIKDPKHLMRWQSPWGVGYPGWHIECSAMAMKYLGPSLDIHTGGEDNIFPHHENEIAQSEAATGKQFVRYWLHIHHHLVNGKKMSKSKGNFLILQDLIDKGFDPLAYRYLCLTAHYRTNLNFTWKGLRASQSALARLRAQISNFKFLISNKTRTSLSQDKLAKINDYQKRFVDLINNDLAIPQALALMWEVVKSNIPPRDKLDLILDFDQIFGLKLAEIKPEKIKIPQEVKELVGKREELRREKKWQKADKIRKKVESLGFLIEDTPKGAKMKTKQISDFDVRSGTEI